MDSGSNSNDEHLSHAGRRRRRRIQEAQNQSGSSNSNSIDRSDGTGCLPGGQKVYADANGNNGDCAVCLMPYLYPTVLPCGHMFCYLCIKGIVRSVPDALPPSCPMCRSTIPKGTIIKPTLYEPLKRPEENDASEFKWFYQRRKKVGWWQYDERTSKEIEDTYNAGREKLEVMLCGEIYIIDFKSQTQYPKKDPVRTRRITRSTLDSITVTGVSGIE